MRDRGTERDREFTQHEHGSTSPQRSAEFARARGPVEREMTDDTEPGVEKIMEHTHAEYWDNTLRAAEGRYLGGLLLYLSW
jgi:hypothetical protein